MYGSIFKTKKLLMILNKNKGALKL